jgi:putative transposase
MPRQARIVLPGYPHHVVQRGNRRQQTFFEDGDYAHFRDLMAAACARFNIRCWAWCLMPNHVHLVLEPADETGLAKAVAQAHQRYTRHINAREGWTGFLWQGRFSSCAMDEAHALMAVRYVELNPVKARLCQRAQDWSWSSARYHHGGPPDGLTADAAYLSRIADWARYLEDALTLEEEARLGYFTTTGYPMGETGWLADLETKSARRLTPRPRGRPREGEDGED